MKRYWERPDNLGLSDSEKAAMWDFCVSRKDFPRDSGDIGGWVMQVRRDNGMHSFSDPADCVRHEMGVSVDVL